MTLFNAVISYLAELGMLLCILITVFMVNTQLGIVTLGLYTIYQVSEYMIRREHSKKMKELFSKAEKL